MPNSMTGFGRAVLSDENAKVTIEIKSVNSRYLEISTKMSRQLNYFEESIRNIVKSKISRGRVELFIQLENNDLKDSYNIDENKIISYRELFEDISQKLGIENDMKLSSYLDLPDVMSKNNEADENIENLIKNTLKLAVDNLQNMRSTEGEKIIQDLNERAKLLKTQIDNLEEYTYDIQQSIFDKIQKRITDIISKNSIEIDETRILQESAIYADKLNITEEIVRFNAHISQLENFLNEKNKEVGKKIDFLLQEMNREINTIGSKSQKTEIITIVLDIKAELEKIREQIQNIE